MYHTHLSHRRGQEVDYPVVGDGDHALTVDLDDAVADADPSTLGDATAKQTADLERDKMRDNKFKNFCFRGKEEGTQSH